MLFDLHDEDIGQAVLDLLEDGSLFRIDEASIQEYASGHADRVVFIWSANAQEQVGAAVIDLLRARVK